MFHTVTRFSYYCKKDEGMCKQINVFFFGENKQINVVTSQRDVVIQVQPNVNIKCIWMLFEYTYVIRYHFIGTCVSLNYILVFYC